MFSQIIDLKKYCDEKEIIDFLYNVFKVDFIENKTYLANKIYIDPKPQEKKGDKEEIFWHIITRKNKGKRNIDHKRASRIKWIKPIISNHEIDKIKFFYCFEDNKKIRLYLWAHEVDFIVILQKLGNKSSYMVTSFYVDNLKKRKKLQKKFETYENKEDLRLDNCEWF